MKPGPEKPPPHDKFFLYGPSGSGKTDAGRKLAEALALGWTDLDAEIERASGRSIGDIFAADGEAAFRALESQALAEACRPAGERVISLGGGALLSEENRALAERSGAILLLQADAQTIQSRLQAAPGSRPLLGGQPDVHLESYLAARRAHYGSFPLQVDTSRLDLDAVVREAQVRLGAFRVTGMGRPYDVRVRTGGLARAGAALHLRGLKGPLALVTDQEAGGHYAGPLVEALSAAGYPVTRLDLPAGERHKTPATLMRIWDALFEAGLERASTVLALGGGVVGDLAGFAAATYLRGVHWANLPTTLLAMVDAALGGKTGADLPGGKNLVGAFHAPSLVLADPAVLRTLPEAEIRSGMAEVVKHGVIGDPALLQFAGPRKDDAALVARAMAVKIDIICADPYEGGRREALNFGHTIGHGLELASDFVLRHGEAVAIGMVLETQLAERIGLAGSDLSPQIAKALEAAGLPTRIPAGLDREAVLAAVWRDKKIISGALRFALPASLGEVRTGVVIGEALLREVLAA